MYLVVAVTVLEFTAELIVEFNPLLGNLGWDTALKVSGLAILVVMTLRHTFRPGPISVHRVMGGVAAYLRIGLGVRIKAAHGRAARCNPFPILYGCNPEGGTEPFDLLQLRHAYQRGLW
jgi:hypothetical protein